MQKVRRKSRTFGVHYIDLGPIFCVATFSVALLNIVMNIIFLNRYFNDTRELFQDSGLNYGHVALCNSLIILSISTLLIWGCDNYLKVLKWSIYIMPAFQLAEIIFEFFSLIPY